MKFSVSCSFEYHLTAPETLVLNIRPSEGLGQTVLQERFTVLPGLDHCLLTCGPTGTRFDRLHTAQSGLYTIDYEAVVETRTSKFRAMELVDHGPESFDVSLFGYLYPSRYCQCDRLGNVAHDLFGNVTNAEEKVRAVVAWLSSRLAYIGGTTNSSTSAVDTVLERVGVCRDFAHLGIALCRALNIPARYVTGYAHQVQPPDFHACFETWIGGQWLFWDATGLASPDGFVRIGTGRDAADCAICTSFGILQLQSQHVTCKAMEETYQKMSAAELAAESVCLG